MAAASAAVPAGRRPISRGGPPATLWVPLEGLDPAAASSPSEARARGGGSGGGAAGPVSVSRAGAPDVTPTPGATPTPAGSAPGSLSAERTRATISGRWLSIGGGCASIHWISSRRYWSERAGSTSSMRTGTTGLRAPSAIETSRATCGDSFAASDSRTTAAEQLRSASAICSAHGREPRISSGAMNEEMPASVRAFWTARAAAMSRLLWLTKTWPAMAGECSRRSVETASLRDR
ncbi:MAG: hypothetical protein QOH61_1677 [Chloroflexota bacterium]|nr:hypothetical protein [Chloroflexota bacterium]